MKTLRLQALVLLLAGLAGAAMPAPARAQLGASCTVSSTGVSFGSYVPISLVATTNTGTITVSCSATLGLTVNFKTLLSAGNSGNVQNRRMASGAHNLLYNLYTDPTFTNVWDNTTGESGTVVLLGLLNLFQGSTNQIVYGRIPARQSAAGGSYADMLTITVSY